ncbi:Fe2+-enterobactin ABC transporter substrate-binding protein [Corynebacterium cystitidis]|uniref:Iron complex transport system substrate-binding protein n=1 Tax=Corynebacterium cystitidis DSM 20524 TaxID=1121357 RepID=A0A1H9VTQ4_9CORY|nr:Fe2+-enterobactin ABC transporter substrate-binding protein [Corynebacterium cystitidis]WJY81090.1 Ferrienterobactin-binding periplasmic protein precursor [Corynebacterium cystitidis DSM 20524]SES24911.1 iron complex transport system substrate-binding protein [Corynebacterium cystitidis DSM 20524]SNV90050.1 siderophore-binding protein [Corynebacterium cystitidis]
MVKNFRRTLATISCAVVATTGLVACSSESADTGGQNADSTSTSVADNTDTNSAETAEDSAESTFPLTLETLDKDGQPTEITIPEQPERVVSASVTLTGALLAIDAPVVASGGGNPNTPMFADGTGFGLAWNDIAEERGVEPIFTIGSADAEAILEQEPDLVVMSNVGADSGAEIYDQLKDIVPVQVIDYSDQSWQETTQEVAKATGLEQEAEKVISDYEDAVKKAKGNLDIAEPVNLVTFNKDNGMNFFTSESAQGQVFADLGIELSTPAPDLVAQTQQGSNRGDINPVNAENLPLALDGETVFALSFDTAKPADEQLKSNPALAEIPAVVNDNVVNLDARFFRIDAFTAQALVEFLVEISGAE